MSEELKPCPFCGGEASRSTGENGDGTPWKYVECLDCAAMAEEQEWQNRTGVANEIAVAINADRNTRPDKPLTVEQLTLGISELNRVHDWWIDDDVIHALSKAIHAALPDQQEHMSIFMGQPVVIE